MVQGTTNQAIRGGQTSGLLGDAAKDNTNYNQQSDMRQEDFQNQAETYANKCGGTTQEKCATMTDYFAGCEHGYQYAVDKACEWLESMSGYVVCGQKANVNNFRKAMQ